MSETYKVTALKWRPQKFEDVVGQDHITRTLKNAIKENRLAHAYLFTGQRGCGKTTVARVLAKAINCPNAEKNNYEPCNTCDSCLAITNGSSMDVAEIDGASNNSVDDVRAMRENVKYPPLNGKYRVVIIDEVHMLSTAAFNALLKTLEEPPRHLVFIFATTEIQKVLPTILSRVQRYDFRRMQIDEIVKHLKHIADADKITYDDDSLLVIAKKADGSMRDGQSVFDQAVAFSGGKLSIDTLRESLNLIDADFYFNVSDAIIANDSNKAFLIAQNVVSRGYDIEEFISGTLEHLRNFMTAIVTKKSELLEVSKVHQERYLKEATEFTEGDLLRLTKIGFRALEQLKNSPSPKMVLELMLVEMTLLEKAIDIRSLLEDIKLLREGGALPTIPTDSKKKVAAEAPTPKVSLTPVTEAVSTPTASLSDVSAKWHEFKVFLAEKSIPLRLIIDDIDLKETKGSTLVLEVSKNLSVESIGRNKDTIKRLLKEFFGSVLDIETNKVERAAPLRQPATSASAPPPTTSRFESAPEERSFGVEVDHEQSELELELVKVLGAVPV
jgi:DNA polymerase III subunit gamma/tau